MYLYIIIILFKIVLTTACLLFIFSFFQLKVITRGGKHSLKSLLTTNDALKIYFVLAWLLCDN